ncbi:MAG: UDP-N-acetylmuramoyl-L-alanine--D-glutamate ligase [Clostridia bacterium]|nr:UDP-N-acetylmuramoyl-L-alanine--D-glutamate ligase [Clostridia bacterium]
MKTALIVGMARSGVASAKLLYRNGYKVIVNDMKSTIPGLSEQLTGIEYENALGKDPMELLDGVDLMVLSPVVPIFKPFAVEAMRRGIEVIGEIELGYRFSHGDFICISGTNGKTTTTALTGEVFRSGGRNTFVLGNIGIPITEKAMETREGDAIVAEVAALQLESIKDFHAKAVAMLNISEDHLNRFQESMDNYIAAKCRVFENQTEEDFAVLNADDPIVADMAKLTRARVLYFSRLHEVEAGAFVRDGKIIWRLDGTETEILPANEVRIPGAHNLENALAAVCLGMCQGLAAADVARALVEFPGVEHRLEFVKELGGVAYINDSKGTNPDSTIKAVEAMTRPTVLLLGVGEYDKHSDFEPLFRAFGGRIKAVLASGLNIPAIQNAARRVGFKPVYECRNDLKLMVEQAKSLAVPGDAVLLSPAAASWGLFEDFEQRGRVFKQIVNELAE